MHNFKTKKIDILLHKSPSYS